MSSLKIQLSQLNFTVGDLDGNCAKIIASYNQAKEQNVDLIIFSELAITGYPPEDLLNKKYFLDEVEEKITKIKDITLGNKTAILVGTPHLHQGKTPSLHNSALLIEDGETIAIASKTCLPNYGIFDEHRYFIPSPKITNFEFRGLRLAILICEDIWRLKNTFLLGDKVFDAIISINASPFTNSKALQRLNIVRKFIEHLQKPVIYVNQIGGQDSLVFDGGSFVMKGDGKILLQMKEFAEDSAIIELGLDSEIIAEQSNFEGQPIKINPITLDPTLQSEIINLALGNNNFQFTSSKEEKIYSALILGLRDYIKKNGFRKVLIGMSGGIDSALVAAIAVDALGNENVKLVALPTKFNSKTSMDDASTLAKNLNIKLEVINIQNTVDALNKALEEQFDGTKIDTTEENIQSRVRGNILMALSNKFGHILLSTGNKSELAVGYATIYGDMCGGFNPIKDIYKTEVFKLAKWRNENIPKISSLNLDEGRENSSKCVVLQNNIIPENIITKAPTAELRENQKDSDSLPEYEILDQILYQLIEEEKSVKEIIKSGFDENLVKNIAKLFFNSEYKRKQAVLGVKISEKSFDKDRRYPIINQFRK